MRRTSIVSHLLNTYYKPAFLYRSLTFFLTAGTIKVIVVGNGAVGKTSMIQRFCKGGFGNDYIKTLGVDFIEKPDYRVDSIDDAVTMNVWDTAGQEEYDAVTAQYYRGGHHASRSSPAVQRPRFGARSLRFSQRPTHVTARRAGRGGRMRACLLHYG
jgi:hypothetical protein